MNASSCAAVRIQEHVQVSFKTISVHCWQCFSQALHEVLHALHRLFAGAAFNNLLDKTPIDPIDAKGQIKIYLGARVGHLCEHVLVVDSERTGVRNVQGPRDLLHNHLRSLLLGAQEINQRHSGLLWRHGLGPQGLDEVKALHQTARQWLPLSLHHVLGTRSCVEPQNWIVRTICAKQLPHLGSGGSVGQRPCKNRTSRARRRASRRFQLLDQNIHARQWRRNALGGLLPQLLQDLCRPRRAELKPEATGWL
mmetsp:Transcript_20660/g.48226  ORF Transcript_20660/g.48226 Transcript_20660/m.48226 type:complete len:252 (-) Transcript_20660:639-1394(-)